MIRPKSLQGRLLALVLGLVAGVWLASVVAIWFDVRQELDELLDDHLVQAAAMLVAHQPREIEDVRGVDAPTLHRYAPQLAFQVFHKGRLVLRSANAPEAPTFGVDGRFNAGFRSVTTDGVAWRVFAARDRESDIQVYVGERANSRASILQGVVRSLLWPMGLALPMLAMAVWWAVRRGVAPLRGPGRVRPQRPKLDALNEQVAEDRNI
jgi:two-component system sensor histidine kinase QseC